MISGSKIRSSVIGFGLNVNQDSFKNIPHAASLKEIVGRSFDLDEVLYVLIENLNKHLMKPIDFLGEELFAAYHANLYRIGKLSKFRIQGKEFVNGVIKGITDSGKLQVEMQNSNVEEFGLKEIQLIY